MRYLLRLLLVLCAVLVSPSHAEDETKNWIWAIWENEEVNPDLCALRELCLPITTYVPVLMDQPTKDDAQNLIGSFALSAQQRSNLDHSRPPPEICKHVNAAAVLGFDPEAWELSDRMLALRGLEGVYVATQNVRGPASYGATFNDDLHAAVEQRFQRVGLRLLTKDEMETVPGKPEMNIYFSNTDPSTGCWFRFFAGLSQTVLLTRNHTVKLKTGTWGIVGGYSADTPEVGEMASILLAIDAFVEAWVEANANPLQAKNVDHTVVSD